MRNNGTVQFVHTTPEQLYIGVKEIVKNEFEELKLQFQPKKPTELLTRQEVADLFKIDLSTLWHWTKKNKFKSYGIGNRVYYKRSEVENSIVELKH